MNNWISVEHRLPEENRDKVIGWIMNYKLSVKQICDNKIRMYFKIGSFGKFDLKRLNFLYESDLIKLKTLMLETE
jgi:hypothetical protein